MNLIGIEPLAEIRFPRGVAEAGTYQDWRAAIDAATGVADCPHWTLGAAAGFVGPVLSLCGFDTCGLNFSGPTSRGKTTAVALGVSAWTNPHLTSGGLLRSMRATENSVELSAWQSHCLILGLDELAHIEGKAVGRTIYFLAGGVGKARMSAQLTMRPQHSWRTFVLLSSEKSLQQKVAGDGGQWTGGMAVRFLDVDCSDVEANVSRETLARIADIYRNYGWAGGAFVGGFQHYKLDRDPDALRARILAAADTLAGDDSDGARRRAALPFALILVCGKLAQDFGVFPGHADISAAVNWGWEQFTSSTEAQALNPQELALSNLRRWIAEHWDAAIKHVTVPSRSTRDALGWYDDNAIYLSTVRLSEAIGGVLSERAAVRLLVRAGLLLRRTDAEHAAIRYVPQLGRLDAYALKRSEFLPKKTTSTENGDA